jgi:hypothetical protein
MELELNGMYLIRYKDYINGSIRKITVSEISPNGLYFLLESLSWDEDRWEHKDSIVILDKLTE